MEPFLVVLKFPCLALNQSHQQTKKLIFLVYFEWKGGQEANFALFALWNQTMWPAFPVSILSQKAFDEFKEAKSITEKVR
jgi:hypothetical protein